MKSKTLFFNLKALENPEKNKYLATEALNRQLADAGIDTSLWGITAGTKTLEDLQKEIESGETVLTTKEAGELLRKVAVVVADIYYESSDGKKYRLKEDRQVFGDGRERRRDLWGAVSEKIKQNENPNQAMIRGIQEELGIRDKFEIDLKETDTQQGISPSYLGLNSEYTSHKFLVILKEGQYNPSGYREVQSGIETIFIWEECEV